jgi:hypothetical protein
MMMMLALALALLPGLFLAMVALVEVGRRLGRAGKIEGLAAVEGAVFGLMGLLLAFTFGSAAARFESRRDLVVEEVNDIGTAYLRLDLLPATIQPQLRDAFRRYVDIRIAIYRHLPDIEAAKADLARMTDVQNEIWATAVTACREAGSPPATMLLLPALNDMIDITTVRTVALQLHQPPLILVMLAAMMLACALLAGFNMAGGHSRSWLHVVCFSAVLTIAFYVILDLEYPRFGLIRIDWMDQLFRDLRNSMGS